MSGLYPLEQGYERLTKFGALDNCSTTRTVVATAGVYPTPSAPATLELVSSSANDTAAGTGARTVRVIGIGADWTEISEDVTTNGITPVTLTNQFLRVYRMFVTGSGTYASGTTGSHAGTLTLRLSGGASPADDWATIDLAADGYPLGQTQIAAYTVPKGKKAYFLGGYAIVEGTKEVSITFMARDNADTTTAPFTPARAIIVERGASGQVGHTYSVARGPFVGPTDIIAFAQTATGTSDIAVTFEIVLKNA